MGNNVGSSPDSALTANAAESATSSDGSSYSPDSTQDLANGMGLGSGFKSGLASSADWKDTLQRVRFKGVPFPATQVKNTSGRKLVKHVYPYRDGQEVVDLGRTALTINVSAIFVNEPFLVQAFGEDLYPGRYEALLAAINTGESGELRHPMFGTINAACESYNDTTQATEINTVRLELTFVEDNFQLSMPTVGTSPIESAAAAAVAMDKFALSEDIKLPSEVGTTFSETVAQFTDALLTPGKSQDEVQAELELAMMNIEMLMGALPQLDDPINAEAAAELAALMSALKDAATEYLAGQAPLVTYVTRTQTTTTDIAVEKYMDPGRALEIERLNNVPDPLDLAPGTELKIYAY